MRRRVGVLRLFPHHFRAHELVQPSRNPSAVQRSTSGDSTARIILLMPMLREDRIVRHAIGQHEQLLRCKGNIDIVVVTSEREAQEREYCIDQLARMARNEIATGEEDIRKLARIAFEGDVAKGAIDLLTGPGPDKEAALGRLLAARKRPLTETGARAAARELNGRLGRKAVHVAVSPAEMAGKVGQMNAALPLCKRLAEGRPGPVFIGVYDADSSPAPSVVANLERAIAEARERGHPPAAAYQQVSCYIRNAGRYKGWRGALAIAEALAQTRWALGFEFPLFLSYEKASRAGALRPLIYCIGHGCFVALGFLERVGGFPTQSPNDDLALGYLISALGEPAAPLSSLDFCDPAPDPIALIAQSRFWYRGSARFKADLDHYVQYFSLALPPTQMLAFRLTGTLRNLTWAWRPSFAAAGIVAALLAGQPWLALAVLGCAALYVLGGLSQTWSQLRRIPDAASIAGLGSISLAQRFRIFAVAPFIFAIRSIGPATASLGLFRPPEHRLTEKMER